MKKQPKCARRITKYLGLVSFIIAKPISTSLGTSLNPQSTDKTPQASPGIFLTWPVHGVDNSRREPSHGAVSTMAASGSVGVMAPQQEQQRQQDPESLTPMTP